MRNFSKILTAVAMFSATQAHANPDLNCDAYASAAVAQVAHANSLGCQVGGNRWTPDYAAHKNWCLKQGVTINHVSIEDQHRKTALNSCQTKVNSCNAYAQNAVEVAQKASNCGYQGSRWSANYAGHKQWCMSVSSAAVAQEDKIRSEGYSQCLIGNGSGLSGN